MVAIDFMQDLTTRGGETTGVEEKSDSDTWEERWM